MKNRLAIFDLDGTLYDTDGINYAAYQKAVEDEGYDLSYPYFMEHCRGIYYRVFLPPIIPGCTEEDMTRIYRRKQEEYPRHLDKVKRNEHLFAIMEALRPDYHIALATAATGFSVNAILTHFNAEKLFDYIVTQEDVRAVKPDPECFLKAMEHFGIGAENTLIFEDAPIGIQAAEKTGASVMRIVKI